MNNKRDTVFGLAKYFQEFAKTFSFYLAENRLLLQYFTQMPSANNFLGEGRQSHALIVLYKTIHRNLLVTQS